MLKLNKRNNDSLLNYDFDDFFTPFTNKMNVDILEKEDSYLLKADIPGIDKKDVELTIKDDLLTINIKAEEQKKEKHDNFIRRERVYGSMQRIFTVEGIKQDEIKAEVNKGVLKIVLPKETKTIPKERIIQIQ